MSANTVDFRLNRGPGEATRLRSPNVWYDCPVLDIIEGNRNGIFYRDDFNDLPLHGTITTQIALGKYKVFGSTGATITKETAINSVEVPGGALQLLLDGDNESCSIAQTYPAYMVTGLTTNSGKLWFECCYAQASIATNMASSFFGLGEVDLFTLAAGVPLNAGDPTSAGGSLLGFQVTEDGLGVVNAVYNDRATSLTVAQATAGTLAAYTFKKFGMVYDPYATDAAQCIKWYVDNLQVGQTAKSTLTALTNLDANALGLLFATVADTGGTAHKGFMKWWACAQVFEPLG